MPTNRTFQLDIDTKRYCNRVNVHRKLNGLGNLLPPDVADIDNFVVGLKDLGVWTNTVCWLMGSKYNVGAGTIALSMNNIYDATLVSSPTWNPNWIDTSPTNSYMFVNYPFLNRSTDKGTVISCFSNFASNYGIVYSLRGTLGLINILGTRNATNQIYGTFSGGNATVTRSSLNTNNLQFASIRRNGTASYTTRWNATNATTNETLYPNTAPANIGYFQIGREVTTQYAVRVSLFVFVRDYTITDAQHDSIESLVKSSIGRALGLN
jgi:hypothetical protein